MSLKQGLTQTPLYKDGDSNMYDNLLSVSHNKEIDLSNGEVSSNVFIRVYTTMFTSGLVAKMGANRFATLMALASFMDENGECYPTQQQVAEVLGVHKNTVNKYVNELLEFEIGSTHIVTRKKVNRGQGKIYSVYKIHPLSQLAKFNGKIEEIDNHNSDDSLITSKGTTECAEIISNNNHSNNIKEILVPKVTNSNNGIKYFQQLYYEKYGQTYTVSNYGREGKILKDKVIKPYPDLAQELIEVAISEYETMFKNPRYPRPTITMFSWAVNQLLPKVQEKHELDEKVAQAEEVAQVASASQADKLSKLKGLGNHA